MAKDRFSIAKKDIIAYFDRIKVKVFQYQDISEILIENRDFWRLTKKMTLHEFIEKLVGTGNLKIFEFSFPNRTINRFVWKEASLIKIASTLQDKMSYISHYSAIYIHNLTLQVPKSIYVNSEQKPKNIKKSKLIQENIKRAFSNKQRLTNNFANFEEFRIFLLNGKNTSNLGVIDMEISGNEKVAVTNVERTLIDITVRPSYSGGIFQIIDAFKRAKDKVSINKLTAFLKKLNYIYPYHQAIGFYLERSGVYKESQIKLLNKFDIKYNFYLAHNMKDTAYSKKWKLYYPKGF